MAINKSDERLNKVFSALADPTRRAILRKLIAGEASASDLAKPFQLAQPTISKHLRVLEDAGLVVQGRDAQRRPRQLVSSELKQVVEWLEPFRQEWNSRFLNLESFLHQPKKKEKKSGGRNNDKS